ncbi:hypothetical protein [Streptomyces malaysiensis]|nr:hypothetical protein [Streptomyces malaysiensis]
MPVLLVVDMGLREALLAGMPGLEAVAPRPLDLARSRPATVGV